VTAPRCAPGSLIVAIDPGATTGLVVARDVTKWEDVPGRIEAFEHNEVAALNVLRTAVQWEPIRSARCHVLLEDVTAMARSVHELDTLRLIGRMEEAFHGSPWLVHRVPRDAVCRWLGTPRKDKEVRRALASIYGDADAFRSVLCRRRNNVNHGEDCLICKGTGHQVRGAFAGVSGHSVQALGLLVGWLRRPRLCPCPQCEATRRSLQEEIRDVVGDASGPTTRAAILRVLHGRNLDVTLSRLARIMKARPRDAEGVTGVPGVLRLTEGRYRGRYVAEDSP
jgi:hypothetical protein